MKQVTNEQFEARNNKQRLLHHVGTARSLWNYCLSPGWTKQEVEILKLALMKHGIGNWSKIVEEEYLPTKNMGQMYTQT